MSATPVRMRTIHLYGFLADELGPSFRVNAVSIARAVRLLEANFPGRVLSLIRQGRYHVVHGDWENGRELTAEEVSIGLGAGDFHLVPAGCGAARGKGFLTAILGTLLVAGAVILSGGSLAAPIASLAAMQGTAFGTVASIGTALAVGGIASLLSPVQRAKDSKTARSYMFNGQENTSEQGRPVPIVYGRVRIGSFVASAGIHTDKVSAASASGSYSSIDEGSAS